MYDTSVLIDSTACKTVK